MKKFFKNLAVASLAIAGILVSSCKVEDINTTFDPTAAVATITVTALDAYNGNIDISNDPALKLSTDINSSNITINGNVITVTGTPAIAETSFNIIGEYNGVNGSAPITVNALLAGGQGTYKATVVIGVPDPAYAYAFIAVNSFDATTGEDITGKVSLDIDNPDLTKYSYVVDSDKGTITIYSKQGIAGGKIKILGDYGDYETLEQEITIDAIDKYDYKNYATTLVFGEAPVADPAQVDVYVTVFDTESYTDVTADATITAEIVGGGDITVTGNVATVVAKDNETPLSAMTISFGANYNGHKAISDELNVAEVPAGIKATYYITLYVGSQASYSAVPKEPCNKEVEVGTFFSTHGKETTTHSYSEATHGHGEGEGEWLYNESEFILKTQVTYTPWSGVIVEESDYRMEPDANELDEVYVNGYYEAYLAVGLEKDTEKTLSIEVSAWAMYSAYGTKTFSTVPYEVYRRLPGDTEGKLVGTIYIREVTTNAEYCEAAMPGHSGHYHYGHGQEDVHGYGSNAGGGIIWAE